MKKLLKHPGLYVVLLIIFGLFMIVKPSGPGENDALAQCLTANDVKMYGTDWCSHCQNQKAAFGKSFKYIDFINCDYQKEACLLAGVQGYPTWVINGESHSGVQPLIKLAALTECEA